MIHCIITAFGLSTDSKWCDTMSCMSTIADTAADVNQYYVTPGWVAEFYGVSRLRVYRAIRTGKLMAVKVRGGSLVVDSRTLPVKFP